MTETTAVDLEVSQAGAPLHWAVRVPGATAMSLTIESIGGAGTQIVGGTDPYAGTATPDVSVSAIDTEAGTFTLDAGFAVLAGDRLTGVLDLDPATYAAGTTVRVWLTWTPSADLSAPVPGAFFASDMPTECIPGRA